MMFKITTIVAALAATVSAGILDERTANCGDNCARDIKAGNLGQGNPNPGHVADCNAYFGTTITPPATTTYITSYIPNYASDCLNPSSYRSACNCATATGSTVVLPTPTVTVIVQPDFARQ